MCLDNFVNEIKDMLDASVVATSVYEFIERRRCEIGGEDGLGTIVLPRKFEV